MPNTDTPPDPPVDYPENPPVHEDLPGLPEKGLDNTRDNNTLE